MSSFCLTDTSWAALQYRGKGCVFVGEEVIGLGTFSFSQIETEG